MITTPAHGGTCSLSTRAEGGLVPSRQAAVRGFMLRRRRPCRSAPSLDAVRSMLLAGGYALFLLAARGVVAHALDILPHSFSRSSSSWCTPTRAAGARSGRHAGEDTKAGLLARWACATNGRCPSSSTCARRRPGVPDAVPPVRLTLAQTGTGLKIELDLLTGEKRAGARASATNSCATLLLELAYRDAATPAAGRTCTLPPPWLVEGFRAYLENVENGVSASMFAALLPTSQTLSITEFLGQATRRDGFHLARGLPGVRLQSRLPAPARDGRRAGGDGWPSSTTCRTRLPTRPAAAAALGQHFPELAVSPDGLEKWWTLGLARLADADRYRGLHGARKPSGISRRS